MSVNLNEELRGAGSIDKWSGYYRIIAVAVLHDPYSSPPGISGILYMVQGTGNFAMSAAGAFVVINFYPGHFLFLQFQCVQGGLQGLTFVAPAS